jgi:hypothetical protein
MLVKDADWRQHQCGALLFYLLLWLGLVGLVSMHIGINNIGEGDTRLYHLNMVRWNNEYAVVPGLANLHQRLGVNSTWLLYAALLDVGWADGRSAWLIAGLPLALALAQWLAVLLLCKDEASRVAQLYCLLTLPYLVELIERSGPSLYYDKPPLLLLLAVGLHLVQASWLRLPSGQVDQPEWLASATWVLTACALAFSLKASCALAMVLVTVALLIHWWNQKQLHTLLRIWWLPTLLVLLYMVTNVITSGWPLFPMPLFGLKCDWSQPITEVQQFNQIILDWAKVPGSDGPELVRQSFWSWWRVWLNGFYRSAEYTAALLAGALSLLVGWLLVNLEKRQLLWKRWSLLWLLALPMSSLLFWVCTAPDLRFGDGMFHLWLGLSGAVALHLLVKDITQSKLAATGLALLIMLQLQPRLLPREAFTWMKVPQAKPEATQTVQHSNTPAILVPVDASKGELGDSALPSAPALSKELRWRKEGDLSAGFRWQN